MRPVSLARRAGIRLCARLCCGVLLCVTLPAAAATFHVSNEAELVAALESVNGSQGPHFIEFTQSIALSGPLPPVLNSVTIKGHGHTLSGQGDERLLLIGAGPDAGGPRILVNLNDIVLREGHAQGGAGQDGGGGGMGAGGAVFVNSRADVVLNNVSLADNAASGGQGSDGLGGGGGGLGGDGGAAGADGGGGGGGLQGDGGAGEIGGGGGGGLAAGGDGGAASGGGGGGLASGGHARPGEEDGADGHWDQPWANAEAGAGHGGGSGGQQGGGGGAGDSALPGGGGGGGFDGQDGSAASGGAGGTLGGGGGSADGASGSAGSGGFGGGGGGGAGTAAGGQGGTGGGGGGAVAGVGGDGGFGGGGGSGTQGGAGGLGGGGGAGGTGGAGGVGGGQGSSTGGGGGAGLGGAIFVAEGGGLTVAGRSSLSGGGVQGGLGGTGAGEGQAAGEGLFLQGSGNLTLRGPGSGQQLVIADSIADSVGAGLAGANDYDRWNLIVTGTSLEGEVHLRGNNTYSGDTYVTGTTLVVQQDANLGGSNGIVVLDGGGLGMGNGFNLTRDVMINSGGGHFAVQAGGTATVQGDVTGEGSVTLAGEGNLVLATDTAFAGSWILRGGNLVLDSDARLGSSSLIMDGGGILFSDAFDDLRTVLIGEGGARFDNGGHSITLPNALAGIGDVRYRGDGEFIVTGPALYAGNTYIESGTVTGAVSVSALDVAADANWNLGGADRVLTDLSGEGTVNLEDRQLRLLLAEARDGDAGLFEGTLTGAGQLVLSGGREFLLRGHNSHGSTRVESGLLNVQGDHNLGLGPLTLAGGGLRFAESTVSAHELVLEGSGTLNSFNSTTVTLTGAISGSGDLRISGDGTVILDADNTYVGNTIVEGQHSFLALAREQALGQGQLELSGLGGLRLLTDTDDLLPILLSNGGGTLDTGVYQVISSGAITGATASDGLRVLGSGTLILTGDNAYTGLTDIAEGVLQLGQGGTSGSLAGDILIAQDARLDVHRDGVLTLDGRIHGAGSIVMDGPGVLQFSGTHINMFTGGLRVQQGYVGFDAEALLGLGPVTLDGGGLLFGSNLRADLEIATGGGELRVDGPDTFELRGDTFGTGDLLKSGDGTLVFTGVAEHSGSTHVAEGVLQVGEGLRGILASDVTVEAGAALAFGRDDLSGYAHTISGEGGVIMRGAGELVMLTDQHYTGGTHVESGSVRVGLGGTEGSLLGDAVIDAGARLLFDRSDDYLFAGDISGDGALATTSSGILILTGDASHTGGTRVAGGGLQIGDGGTQGSLSGPVQLDAGTGLLLDRSDLLTLAGDISGAGGLYQVGTGTTVLTGNNAFTGDVRVLDGRLAADADHRLGSGDLILDGGAFAWAQAFDDLRGVRLTSVGGALDTNGFDVVYSNIISGSGDFTKAGDGVLSLTGLIAAGTTHVTGGELRIGDGGHSGTLLGNVFVGSGATLGFERADTLGFNGALSGSGRIEQHGPGSLYLTANSSAFNGITEVRAGRLYLDGRLGGDLDVTGGMLLGAGILDGDLRLASGGTLANPAFGGNLTVGGHLVFEPGSLWQLGVRADGGVTPLQVAGSAQLGGDLLVLVGGGGGGDYADGTVYRILNAASVSGEFDSVASDLVFLTPTLNVGSNYVDLILGRNDTQFVQVSLTRNQRAVAGALDELDPANPVAAYVSGLNAQGARRAYDQLSGDSLTAGLTGGARMGRLFSDHLQQRTSRLGSTSRGRVEERLDHHLGALTGNAPVVADTLAPHQAGGPVRPLEGAWVQARALQLKEKQDDATGNAAFTLNGQLVSAGLDGYWSEQLIVGAGVGLGQGDLRFDDRDAQGDLDTWQVGAYSRWNSFGDLHVTSALSHGRTDTALRRTVPPGNQGARSKAATDVTTLALEAGTGLHLGNYGLRPHLGLQWQRIQRNAFDESEAGGAGLEVETGRFSTGEASAGLEVSRPWLLGADRWAQVQAGASLIKAFGDTRFTQQARFSGTEVPFTVSGADNDALQLATALGGEVYLARGVSLWGGYQGRFGGAVDEHSALLSLNVRW